MYRTSTSGEAVARGVDVRDERSGSDTVSSSEMVLALSAVTQDYLKVIWTCQEWEPVTVTTKMLAEKLSVSASTASETVRKLVDLGLVSHEPYGAICLTETGCAAALLMVRRHRLLETFLVRELGYGWDEVHDEAEVLEHAVSERFVARLDHKLECPSRDPHGDPIPSSDGSILRSQAALLADLDAGARGSIVRIADSDPEMLRYFESVGIGLDRVVTVVARRDFAGTIEISVDGGCLIILGDIATRAIWLSVR